MIELGKLCKRAWAAGVQVMVEVRATWRSTRSPPI